ncbi:hypothetical protein V2S66_18905 [Streptomyces sp. V4-01]|uniref:Uncharacterized protein n=1 Tax=Actinacidiphila polyblastidii TaxID=3110430 RepID=A0ABU7PEA4_9ACTN|nr:hypothetical protein [Streptomyces sp. V4-01]
MSPADECGTDVEIYRRFGSPVIYADSRTGAPEELLLLLDTLGLQRHEAAPFYVWHQVPEDAQHQVASRACAAVHLAGYRVAIDPDVVDEPVLAAALARPANRPEPQQPAAPPPTPTAEPRRSR